MTLNWPAIVTPYATDFLAPEGARPARPAPLSEWERAAGILLPDRADGPARTADRRPFTMIASSGAPVWHRRCELVRDRPVIVDLQSLKWRTPVNVGLNHRGADVGEATDVRVERTDRGHLCLTAAGHLDLGLPNARMIYDRHRAGFTWQASVIVSQGEDGETLASVRYPIPLNGRLIDRPVYIALGWKLVELSVCEHGADGGDGDDGKVGTVCLFD